MAQHHEYTTETDLRSIIKRYWPFVVLAFIASGMYWQTSNIHDSLSASASEANHELQIHSEQLNKLSTNDAVLTSQYQEIIKRLERIESKLDR